MNKTTLIVSIVERGKGDQTIETYKDFGCYPYMKLVANGTASSELLDVLGFATSKRTIVLSIIEDNESHIFMNELRKRDKLRLHTKGIVFSIPINGISALLYKIANDVVTTETKKEEDNMNQDSLILVSLNQGYSDEVMATAKKYGARGGTVFKANFKDNDYIAQEYQVAFQKEKEILAIVASNEIKKDIMNHIHEEHGLNSKAQALLISLPVSDKVML